MRVVNAMFGRKKGCIEQYFLDYNKILTSAGYEVVVLTYADSPFTDLENQGLKVRTITNFGQWDPVVSWKMKKLIKEISPDAVITHGNRASSLLSKSINDVPVFSVFHNYNEKIISDCKNIITITEDLKKSIIKKGVNSNSIFTVPKIVSSDQIEIEKKDFNKNEIVIGAYGKFVAKKGFSVFIKSLSLLKDWGVNFKAILSGEGSEKEKLINLSNNLNLKNILEFTDEIEKEEFYKKIDIFCLPSLSEPYGTVILEAFSHGVAVVTTDTEGPIEFVRPHVDSLVVETNNPEALADAFKRLIRNPKFAEKISSSGLKKVSSNYNNEEIAKKLCYYIESVSKSYKERLYINEENNMVVA